MYQNGIKIVLDKLVALMALFLLSPVFILIIFILFILQKQVFFIQTRIGKNQCKFQIYKFQTMSNARDLSGKLLADAVRVTTFGKFLRATSLDELPQLLNVLQGNMSWVGPRPLLPDYVHLYSDFQNQRHNVLPGITGYVQVQGRNALTWDTRFCLDVYYVEHISFIFDCKILFLTFIALFDFKKSQATAGISIEPFEGQW